MATGERRIIDVETGALEIELDDNWLDTRCVCGKLPEVCGHTKEDRQRLMEEAELASAAKAPGWAAALERARRG